MGDMVERVAQVLRENFDPGWEPDFHEMARDAIKAMREAQVTADPTIYCPKPGSLWVHRKGGKYAVLCVARVEATLEHVVVYHKRDRLDDVWTRPVAEFMDGRFVEPD
jgi:hypothetical protein